MWCLPWAWSQSGKSRGSCRGYPWFRRSVVSRDAMQEVGWRTPYVWQHCILWSCCEVEAMDTTAWLEPRGVTLLEFDETDLLSHGIQCLISIGTIVPC
jgi:hypothetical protein